MKSVFCFLVAILKTDLQKTDHQKHAKNLKIHHLQLNATHFNALNSR